MRRKLVVPLQAASIVGLVLLFITGLKSGRPSFELDTSRIKSPFYGWVQSSESNLHIGKAQPAHAQLRPSSKSGHPSESNLNTKEGLYTPSSFRPPTVDPKHPNEKLLDVASHYVGAIIAPEVTTFPKLDCLVPSGDRYKHLRPKDNDLNEEKLKYFFALNLHQCAQLLPQLLGSILDTIKFLGPQNCALSIVEGRSNDGTFETLLLLVEELDRISVKYFLQTDERSPAVLGGGINRHRVWALAILRNLALQPLVDLQLGDDTDVTVVFVNDVVICTEDILELIYQRHRQNADMTCAMDWTFPGDRAFFYDKWISRGINGDTFFEIGRYDVIFWNDPETSEKFKAGKPVQVFSCWNGAVTFTAKPIVQQKTKFRATPVQECLQGEPQSFCKDLWMQGYGKIAVVPTVNVAYDHETGIKVKASKGYVTNSLGSGDENDKIEWQEKPPEKVKCVPSWTDQYWVPWNESSTT
ncbi:MAG: hypothetical protein Q9221_005152 [Calogaya cf. arnoldii]